MEVAQVAPLQAVLRQESRSLLQYAREAFPWTKAEGQAACDAIGAMAQSEAESVAKLGRWLAKQHVPLTFPGAYPIQFTNLNFIAVAAFLPRLIADQRLRIAEVERARATLADAAGRALVDQLLEIKQKHLQQLIDLHAAAAPLTRAS
jgi:hypothetical protein